MMVQCDEGEGTDGGVLYENLPRANKDSEAARETALISELSSLALWDNLNPYRSLNVHEQHCCMVYVHF